MAGFIIFFSYAAYAGLTYFIPFLNEHQQLSHKPFIIFSNIAALDSLARICATSLSSSCSSNSFSRIQCSSSPRQGRKAGLLTGGVP